MNIPVSVPSLRLCSVHSNVASYSTDGRGLRSLSAHSSADTDGRVRLTHSRRPCLGASRGVQAWWADRCRVGGALRFRAFRSFLPRPRSGLGSGLGLVSRLYRSASLTLYRSASRTLYRSASLTLSVVWQDCPHNTQKKHSGIEFRAFDLEVTKNPRPASELPSSPKRTLPTQA